MKRGTSRYVGNIFFSVLANERTEVPTGKQRADQPGPIPTPTAVEPTPPELTYAFSTKVIHRHPFYDTGILRTRRSKFAGLDIWWTCLHIKRVK
jgi:hypothetical protein